MAPTSAAKPVSLLALCGLAPQVVTETAWSLARQHHPPLVPERVAVVATGVGEAVGRALLLGEPRVNPVTGQPIAHAADRWTPFCRDVYGHAVPLAFHVPSVGGQPLADVTGVDADRRFADLCYRLVADLTRPGLPPLVGSLAGGRKTLSAHLMAAFAVYARPEDRLVHVLVHPTSAERDPEFFYPTPDSEVRVHRIDVPFPRLRSILNDSSIGEALKAGSDLRALLDVIQPYLDAEERPDACTLTLKDGYATLAARKAGSELATVRLTPAESATLVVSAKALAGDTARVDLRILVGSDAVEVRRAEVLEACGRFSALRPWTAPSDVSKAVSRLNRSLAQSPLIARYFTVESDVTSEATYYRWAEPLPADLVVEAASPMR